MKNNKKVIAVVGMAGSGKTEAVKYLQKKFNWPNVYFGEITFDRIKKDGLVLNYENEKITREKIRAELGMGAYAILSLPKIKKGLEASDVVLIESMYSWEEYKAIKEKFGDNFFVIAVYASPASRLKRLLGRKKERPIKDYAEFKRRDYTEIENINKAGPIAMADFTIVNESALEELHKNIDEAVKKII